MSDDEINQAIAEWMGWYVAEDVTCGLWSAYHKETKAVMNWRRGVSKEHAQKVCFPNYCGDLNAIHETEKKLGNGRLEQYGKLLLDLCIKEQCKWVSGRRESFNTAEMHAFHATARQRCEALLRCLHLWRD